MRSGRAIVLSDYIGGGGAATGGAGHAALDSYRALRSAGADVRGIAAFGTSAEEGIAGLGLSDLRLAGPGGALRAIYNPSARTALAEALSEEDPETTLLILHQWTRGLSPAALGVAARFPLMVYMHDYFWPCPNGIYYDFRLGQPCRREPLGMDCLTADCDRQGRVQKLGRVARQAVRQALTAVSPERRLFLHLSEHARRTAAPLLPGERHAIVYNSMTAPLEAQVPSSPRYDIGYFGRLEEDKGVAALADAVVATGASGLFVGQGSLEDRLRAMPGIVHRSWQPRETMAEAMRQCRAVVLPSRWHETWGLIVPEAMAAGVPVLVSARAGSAELVRRFRGGAIFDPDRPDELRTLIAAVRQDRPIPGATRDELAAFLSPERHAARIMTLAESQFGLDLHRSRSVARAPVPADARAPIPLPTT